MRHRKQGRKFGRLTGPRKALLRSLSVSLVLYEKVKTTEAKAKELRGVVEKMITRGKANTLTARRLLLSQLAQENAVKKILEVLSPRYADRKGGYTRVIKLVRRAGDGAKMAIIEFI